MSNFDLNSADDSLLRERFPGMDVVAVREVLDDLVDRETVSVDHLYALHKAGASPYESLAQNRGIPKDRILIPRVHFLASFGEISVSDLVHAYARYYDDFVQKD